MSHLDFYFDFASPFAYLAATQVERVARAGGATVRWRPLLLGALFREIGTPDVPLFTFPEAKRDYIRRDLLRWADHWQVPFAWPPRFPIRTVEALRLLLAVEEAGGEVAPLAHRLFSAYWVEGGAIDDVAELRALAARQGVAPETVERALLPAPEIRAGLVASTRAAAERGVFGVPSFAVGDALFWGQDRLDLVARTLAGWRPPTLE